MIRMKQNFLQFCRMMTTNDVVTLPDEPEELMFMPENINKSRYDFAIRMVKSKIDIGMIDRIRIPSIEDEFENLSVREKIINIENIDDSIPHNLAMNLFDKKFSDLKTDEQAIIKLLSVYCLL